MTYFDLREWFPNSAIPARHVTSIHWGKGRRFFSHYRRPVPGPFDQKEENPMEDMFRLGNLGLIR